MSSKGAKAVKDVMKVAQGAKAVKDAAVKKEAAVRKEVAATKAEAAQPKKPNGLTMPLPVSAACRKFFGQAEMSRVEVTKQLWVYIKAHNLQSDPDKKIIVCDDKLKEFLNCNSKINMREIPGLLTQHFKKAS